ncbi:protein MANBAL [Dermochelys coriacea]|uniref:protein MANBAL n=1 Tax=Dermochelys coriacea TaxID=27794 RepID=UPI001CA99901|nr:protein MANBAL [Dermochelys coriacea]
MGRAEQLPARRARETDFLRVFVKEEGASAMAAELDSLPLKSQSPHSWRTCCAMDSFFGAIFQLICVLAIILPISKSHKTDSDNFESKSSEVVKKPKVAAPQLSKKPKKETKKKR